MEEYIRKKVEYFKNRKGRAWYRSMAHHFEELLVEFKKYRELEIEVYTAKVRQVDNLKLENTKLGVAFSNVVMDYLDLKYDIPLYFEVDNSD